MDDATLRELHIDRIYDTLIDEDELRICDETTRQDRRRPRATALFLARIHPRDGRVPGAHGCQADDSIVWRRTSRRADLLSGVQRLLGRVRPGGPSAQPRRQAKVSIDSAKDFYELTQLKVKNPTTGLFMIGGGVPKNFAQDIVFAAEVIGNDAPMHKYAVQVSVADVRDGALSGSTLKEAQLGQG